MNRWWNDILNLFFPAQCHLCGNLLSPGERFICLPCTEALPRTGYHRSHRNPMEERFAGQFPFVRATGHFFYTRGSSLSQLIQDMKYRNFPSIGDKMGEIAGRELFSTGFLNEIDLLVPLPMHFMKKARRGYNQTDHIASGLSKATGIPVLDAMKMTRRRKTQTSLSRSERMINAHDLFTHRKGIDLNGKGVLLVDDICTTGATMAAAAEALTASFPDIRLSLFALGVTF
ncbi:MAG: ComF family protein [Muribaculaceae bacterium]|nr:ComF family protein [Muribaculaceae bacterium]